MTRRVVLLRPEDRCDLVDTLEDADHHLLVKLRALRQICLFAEIRQGEDISSALGSRCYELRCVDFGEVLSIQKFAERLTDPGLNLENRALFFISQRDGPVVQQVLDGSVDPLLVDDNRRYFFRLGEDFHV